ncbi:MAG: DUF1549 and DUF1553 domain-containing protein [Planctomycetota bacterium]
MRTQLVISLLAMGLAAVDLRAQDPAATTLPADWCWQPPARTAAPPTTDPRFDRDDIDRFVAAGLLAMGLPAAPAAGSGDWLRRVHFVLIGLPPAIEDLAEFEADDTPTRRAAVVDRLLDSPAFAERWARHWFDLVRYAETMGHEFDFPILGAWRYRDWVIDAIASDLPYDRFLVESIAGDLVDPPRRDPSTGLPISAIGTAGLLLGEQVHSPIDTRLAECERIDAMIDITSKAFLGITLACARCHDHKFDPIPTTDYYAAFGIFRSAQAIHRVLLPPHDAARAELSAAAEELQHAAWNERRSRTDRREPIAVSGTDSPSIAAAASTADAIVVADVVRDLPRWYADGPAFTDAAIHDADVVEILDAEQVRLWHFPGTFVHSARRSRLEVGSLRTNDFVVDRRWLHLLIAGRNSRFTILIDGFRLVRGPIYDAMRQRLAHDQPQWVTIDMLPVQGRRASIELCDMTAPDAADPHAEGGWPADGWIAFARAVSSDGPAPPPPAAANSPMLGGARIRAAIERLRSAEQAVPTPIFVTTLANSDPIDEAVHVRGNPRQVGEVVQHRTPTALGALPCHGPGHGRLAFAESMARGDHPLTARVAVNRLWHHVFGRGLAPTVDNFGRLGSPPLHRELLDTLAVDFVASGWSIKQMVRRLCLSETFALAVTHRDPAAAQRADEVDPNRHWLHAASLRRLDGEAIHDTLLLLGERLDPTRGGPSVPVHLTAFMEGRGRPRISGPIDGAGRRSIYLEVRRNFPDPFFSTFDRPPPSATIGARTTSNVPAQSLALRNDPFVIEMAKRWAARVRRDAAGDVQRAITIFFREGIGRAPSAAEAELARVHLSSHDDDRAWAEFALVVINLEEFRFLR